MKVEFAGGVAFDPTEVLWHHRDGTDRRCIRKRKLLRHLLCAALASVGVALPEHEILVFRPIFRTWKDFIRYASGKSNDWISKTLNGLWNHATVTFPVTLYFALWTASLTAASTGSTAGECSYTGYSRVAVTPNTTNFPTSSGGAAIQNATAITWGANSGTLQTATFAAVCDASTAGNIVMWGSITSTAVNPGDTPQINTNALTATEA